MVSTEAYGSTGGRVQQPRISVVKADMLESPTVIVPRLHSPFQCDTLLNFNSRSQHPLLFSATPPIPAE
jgi:hypothetical protein